MVFTVMTPIALGRMCLKMIRPSDAPARRAASTNSRSRSVRKSPRTSRAMPVHDTSPRKSPRNQNPPMLPALYAMTEAEMRTGMMMIMSVNRMSTDSSQPRK